MDTSPMRPFVAPPADSDINHYPRRLGEPLSLPAAVTPAVLGMREGGRRRILVPPQLGWVSDKVRQSGPGQVRPHPSEEVEQ